MRIFYRLAAVLLITLTACASPAEPDESTGGLNPLEATATARARLESDATPTPPATSIMTEAVDVVAGRNDDGTFYLGQPEAPIVFIDYSDFL